MAKDIVPRSRTTLPAPTAEGLWRVPEPAREGPGAGRTVGLFATCLVDLFRPTVGFAAARLLADAGCKVVVPTPQACCGQPAWNSGDRKSAQRVARQVIRSFRKVNDVVVPSGSCAGMLVRHYPDLFEGDPKWLPQAQALARKTYELTHYLSDVLGVADLAARYDGLCTYHDSCSSLREMQVKAAPRLLLSRVEGARIRELKTPEVCCGFGGTFCVKYPEVSNHMVTDKAADVMATGADTLLAGDMGCLMNIAGKLSRDGKAIRCYHVAEVLAGMPSEGVPPIGEALPASVAE